MIDESNLADSIERLEHCETLPGVLAVVAKVNSDVGPEGITGMTGEIVGKLQEWLGKLVLKLRELYLHTGGAQSYSLTVGTHISVSVNFPVS